MGNAKLTLLAETLNKLNSLRSDFEKSRNLGGILRIIAILAVAKGNSIDSVADLIRTSSETVRNWVNGFIWSGISSLYPSASSGRPKTLTDSEVKTLKKKLEKSPQAYGLRGGCWNANKVKKIIQDSFGKTLSTKYIPEFLRSVGLSYKKARIDCGEKSEFLRSKWIEQTWPKILEVADKQDAHILFGDEAYFSIFGTTSYSWSLVGTETLVESTGQHANIHILGAINFNTGKTHALMLEEGRLDEEVYTCFLQTLLRETRKPIHLILDNAVYHKSQKIKDFIAANAKRLTVHYLPPYSPDYNPIEGLWRVLKKETTHNVYFDSVKTLWDALVKGLRAFRDDLDQVKGLCGFYHNLA
jgi:transposase